MSSFNSSTFTSPSTNKEFFYLTAGPTDGPLIILLHGWPGIALTWKPQIQCLASIGYHVVAPDMPGYGKTWTSKNSSDFALEKLVPQCLELLQHIGRPKAIWIGHDWGCGPLWAIASHHPDVCEAVVGISVPYRTIEFGLNYLLTTIDRDLYPEDKYPNGQWDYQVFYEQDPDAADRFFESDIPKYVKLFFSRGSEQVGKGVARTAEVSKNKGWFGGPKNPMPDIPLEKTVLDQEIYDELVKGLEKTGYRGATSWYLNHAANEKYQQTGIVNGGVLKVPVLFVHTEYDAVCQTVHNPALMKEMRSHCENLQEFVIKTGHWGGLERPTETNAGIVEWLAKFVRDSYPGPQLKAQI